MFHRFLTGFIKQMLQEAGSTGLGLSVAKELAERMGGQISASMEDEMFVIRFIIKF